jgi:hypothetical protein
LPVIAMAEMRELVHHENHHGGHHDGHHSHDGGNPVAGFSGSDQAVSAGRA